MSEQQEDQALTTAIEEQLEGEQVTPEPEPTPEVIPMSEIEAMASAIGWTPEGEKSAMEFMAASREFHDRDRREIRELKEKQARLNDMMGGFIAQQNKKEYQSAQKTLDQQIDEAVEVGDVERVRYLRAQTPVPPPMPPDPNEQYIMEWRAKNAWFDADQELNQDSLGLYQSERLRLGRDDPTVILPIVEERIRKIHPEKFKAPANPNAERGAGVEKGGKSRGRKKGPTRADLTEEETMFFDQFIEAGAKEEDLIAAVLKARR